MAVSLRFFSQRNRNETRVSRAASFQFVRIASRLELKLFSLPIKTVWHFSLTFCPTRLTRSTSSLSQPLDAIVIAATKPASNLEGGGIRMFMIDHQPVFSNHI